MSQQDDNEREHRVEQYNKRDEHSEDLWRRQVDTEMSHSMGYLVAKFESLDRYIRDHMEAEEKRFSTLEKSVRRITIAVVVLSIAMILRVAGVPVDALLIKLLGLIL